MATQEVKQLKSGIGDLRELFDQVLTVRHIAEPLASFDESTPTASVRDFMESKDYDVVGVRRDGLVTGCIGRDALVDGRSLSVCCVRSLEPVLEDTASLAEGFGRLCEGSRVFISSLGRVAGIATRGDLQKAPVRMWLFAVLSLVEMQCLRLVRIVYPHEGWRCVKGLSAGRIEKALGEREKDAGNEAVDLAEYLQFCDKLDLVFKHDDLRRELGFSSMSKACQFSTSVVTLRDDLAHVRDIRSTEWGEIGELMRQIDDMLNRAEGVSTLG